MRHVALAIPLATLSLCSFALAQFQPGGRLPPNPPPPRASVISTATDFGVITSLGTLAGFDAVATGTAVTTPIRATSGIGPDRANHAHAMSSVAFSRTRDGDGATVRDEGSVANADPTIGASAGTSSSAPGSTSPTQGAHGVHVAWPNIAAGTNAILSIHWRSRATTGASVTGTVDWNGDGTADFTGAAGSSTTHLVQLVAGANGVVVDLSTSGNASVAAAGRASYAGTLSVHVMPGTLPTTCTFTNFGTPCGADLNGTVGTGLVLSLDVTNATPNGWGFFMAGDQATTPVPLPLGTCNLLIDGRRFFHGHVFRLDATGAASVPVPTPRRALTISFQAVVLSIDPATNTRTAVASNGTELVCQ